MYLRTVQLYRTQSDQNLEAENFALIATETPNRNDGPKESIPAEEW